MNQEGKDNVATHTGGQEYTAVSICSGYSGIGIGIREAIPIRNICYVEIGVEVSSQLVNLMEQELIDEAPIWTDLTRFPVDIFRDKVDILEGGFPCQPFSQAGKRLQENDPRNLWPAVAGLIRGIRPSVVFLENVPGILRYYFETIRPELVEMGYTVTEGLFSAGADGGASQRRQRLFILAYSPGTHLSRIIPRELVDPGFWSAEQGEHIDSPGEGMARTESFRRIRQVSDGELGREIRPSFSDKELADNKGINVQSATEEGSGRDSEGDPTGKGNGSLHAGHKVADSEFLSGKGETRLYGVEERTVHKEIQEDRNRIRSEFGWGSSELADSDSIGSKQDTEQTELWTSWAEQPSCACGTARQGKEEQDKEGGKDVAGRKELADISSKGCQGIRPTWEEEPGEAALPLFPPGPTDTEGWEWVFQYHPYLAPTFCKESSMQHQMQKAESELHRMVAGASSDVDIRLRLCGNGVVPVVAALALVTLGRERIF